ncbi:hypothetical protein GGU10DRAFT_161981 [Lentinula aff. detonsa]|uniref:Uncharacterized protein n=1 Tax=Lentinula aff. detonsa TaxID=2804958 RepID=A0AA38KT73_9AGAR|nr:hypothetical protein GGU10DRAFT_161981 [Lentinula aff. detonsa]
MILDYLPSLESPDFRLFDESLIILIYQLDLKIYPSPSLQLLSAKFTPYLPQLLSEFQRLGCARRLFPRAFKRALGQKNRLCRWLVMALSLSGTMTKILSTYLGQFPVDSLSSWMIHDASLMLLDGVTSSMIDYPLSDPWVDQSSHETCSL